MTEPARPLAELIVLPSAVAPAAATAAEQKRAFLRMMSHELRTPLNSILGFSEILAGELYGPLGAPQYKEYAEIVRDSGLKLLELINQLLELARLEGGLNELEPRREPVACAVEDVVEQLRAESRVAFHPPKRPIAALADPRALRSALCNLVGNALAATSEDRQVRISARAGRARVEIEVCDAGAAVHPDDLPRLLRPFEKPEAGEAGAGRGTLSLALPTAALLCQAMGGDLTLSSPSAGGLVATVRLPAA
ncbi:MAG: HAMP domain-containing sensor histidine kinase [Phenylobacterium sp.]|uniref:sensor histidine kinase n=1 Tax=Phenylobacterium sp. TaxID=1871053 RepID=UPI003560E298